MTYDYKDIIFRVTSPHMLFDQPVAKHQRSLPLIFQDAASVKKTGHRETEFMPSASSIRYCNLQHNQINKLELICRVSVEVSPPTGCYYLTVLAVMLIW